MLTYLIIGVMKLDYLVKVVSAMFIHSEATVKSICYCLHYIWGLPNPNPG